MIKEQFFFIGTEAELIKVFPVILECQSNGDICNIIASGQNDISNSRIVSLINLSGEFVELSKEETIKKSAGGLLKWFIDTRLKAIGIIAEHFNVDKLKECNIIVHGDTVSTFMGALIGRKLKMRVCHVEAGLRSHNLFNPFPEEIDRLLTSSIARLHFAPGDIAEKNLVNTKGKVINTIQNTLIDSLEYSKDVPLNSDEIKNLLEEDYFVFVMHRQENLVDAEFVKEIVTRVIKLSKDKKCVMIMHTITRNTFEKLGLMNELCSSPNICLLSRVDYFDFMKLLNSSKFVITDGGSNQEELYYMNKPTLILRKTTERQEGIGVNARLFDGSSYDLIRFVESIEYNESQEIANMHPSRIIAEELSR